MLGGRKKHLRFLGGIKLGREYIRKWVICGKTLWLNTRAEIESAVLLCAQPLAVQLVTRSCGTQASERWKKIWNMKHCCFTANSIGKKRYKILKKVFKIYIKHNLYHNSLTWHQNAAYSLFVPSSRAQLTESQAECSTQPPALGKIGFGLR